MSQELDDDEFPIRGKCDTPFDCGTCLLLQQWVQGLIGQGWEVTWECHDCLRGIKAASEAEGVEVSLPGYYQTGSCSGCGYETSFLQLLLRRKHV